MTLTPVSHWILGMCSIFFPPCSLHWSRQSISGRGCATDWSPGWDSAAMIEWSVPARSHLWFHFGNSTLTATTMNSVTIWLHWCSWVEDTTRAFSAQQGYAHNPGCSRDFELHESIRSLGCISIRSRRNENCPFPDKMATKQRDRVHFLEALAIFLQKALLSESVAWSAQWVRTFYKCPIKITPAYVTADCFKGRTKGDFYPLEQEHCDQYLKCFVQKGADAELRIVAVIDAKKWWGTDPHIFRGHRTINIRRNWPQV